MGLSSIKDQFFFAVHPDFADPTEKSKAVITRTHVRVAFAGGNILLSS